MELFLHSLGLPQLLQPEIVFPLTRRLPAPLQLLPEAEGRGARRF
jgi:hypothetical protein